MKTKISELNIKKISVDEIPVLVEYRLLYLTELQGTMNLEYQDKLKTDLTFYFKTAVNEGRFLAFYAELAGKIVSFGGMVIKQIPGDINKSTYLEGDILNMYTIPEARRKGISSVILENLLSEAKKMGISKVALHSSKDGEKLYRSFGFSEPEYPYLERVISNQNFKH
jgi:GNAT superfamily N-acetyltransferase